MVREERVIELDAAVGMIGDGDIVATAGALLHRKPLRLLDALGRAGRRDLHLVTFAGSLDVEILLAHDAVSELSSAYVGLGPFGFAPHFRSATESGRVIDHEYSEWSLLGRIRAAAMGVPFLPTRAGEGSDVFADLGLEEVVDPYTGVSYRAIPPLEPDVAILHAWRANRSGDVQFAWPPEHLWDADVLVARAAKRVIVTVEEIVDDEVVREAAHLTRLFGFEIDGVVELPGGSGPTGIEPVRHVDEDVIRAYARSGGDLGLLRLDGPR